MSPRGGMHRPLWVLPLAGAEPNSFWHYKFMQRWIWYFLYRRNSCACVTTSSTVEVAKSSKQWMILWFFPCHRSTWLLTGNKSLLFQILSLCCLCCCRIRNQLAYEWRNKGQLGNIDFLYLYLQNKGVNRQVDSMSYMEKKKKKKETG